MSVRRCKVCRRPMPRHPEQQVGPTCLARLMEAAGLVKPTRLPAPPRAAAPATEVDPDQLALDLDTVAVTR